MPGLLRGVARTAVVAGTATAVSGRVQRRQAEKYASRDAQIAADRTTAYQQDMSQQQPQYAPPPQPQYEPEPEPEPEGPDMITQLKQLAELRDQGILTEDEFAAQKAKLLG
jgi:Short C-terminal domain